MRMGSGRPSWTCILSSKGKETPPKRTQTKIANTQTIKAPQKPKFLESKIPGTFKFGPLWGQILVLLSGHDSKKYQAALRLKRQIAETPELFPDLNMSEDRLSSNREIDEFGEMATKCVRLEQKRLTSEEVKMLIIEYQAGKTPIELSEKYGCHRITVGRILRRNGVEIRPPHYDKQVVEHQTPTSKFRARDKLDAAEVILMYAEMHTTKEIAQRFGVCSKVVIKCLRENGIKIRNRWDYAKK